MTQTTSPSRGTVLAALIAAIAALFAAFTPIVVELLRQQSSVLGAQSQPVTGLRYSCSETIALDNLQNRTITFPLQFGDPTAIRYPVLLQVFFKKSLVEAESYQMFPVPVPERAVNPMNILTDGASVKITLAGKSSLYALFDPESNTWQEITSGYAYACALF